MKRRTPLKRKTPLRRISKGRSAQLVVYAHLKRFILLKNPYCKCPSPTGAPSCMNQATQIHHVRGRRGALLNQTRYWLPICRECHAWIHDHPRKARALKILY